ncbi:hypothetical protein DFJ43DRAFT_1104888 [Lentinula guzmanii]|uniref:Uncharacterized protein n=1 Tax=Lentinula guzmanii TaxID=2804957 RepID=A0AA38MQP7_9AGAR|nr:hypothetical protein DFJ43DRAFT_1104888 [Lentinula guzmanii]
MEHWIKITQLLWRALLHKSTEDQPTELVRSDIPVEIVEHAASFVKFGEALQKLQDLCQLPRPTSAKSRSHTASSNSTVSNYHRGSLPSSVRTQLTPPSPTPTSKTHSTSQSKKGKGNGNATHRNIFSFSVRRPGSTLHRSTIFTPTPASLIREQYLSSTVDSSASLVSKFLSRKANINFQKMKNQMKGLPGLRWKKAREPVRSISDS